MEQLCKKFTEIIKKEDKKVYEENSLLVEYEWSERDGSYNITTTEARAKKLKIGLSKKNVVKMQKIYKNLH